MRHVLEDIDQDGDGVGSMFVRKVDSQFCESNVALYCSSGLSPRPIHELVLIFWDKGDKSRHTMNILSSSSPSSSSPSATFCTA